MLKKLISIGLLFTLLLQVLPLQKVGYVLFSNQINEELPHSLEEGNELVKKFTTFDDQLLFSSNSHLLLSVINNADSYFYYACSIPLNYAGEINTPPPNIA